MQIRSALNNKNKGLYTQEFIHDLKPMEYVKVILQSFFFRYSGNNKWCNNDYLQKRFSRYIIVNWR